MSSRTITILVAASAVAWAGAGGVPWVAAPIRPTLVPQASAQSKVARQPLYYQAPSGVPEYSGTPRKDSQGRDYVPVYEDAERQAASAPAPAPQVSRGRVLYYRNPMG